MRKVLMIAALLTLAAVGQAQVSDPIGINRGTRVRVTPAGRPTVIGAFSHASEDSIHINDESGRIRSLHTNNIRSVDVSLGKPVHSGRVAKGALTGALVVGGLAGASAIGSKRKGDAGFAAAILAPVGALIGGGWAALTPREEWQSVPVQSLASAASPTSSPPTVIRPAKSKGKHIGIGALVGGAAGAAFVHTQRSSSPKSGQYLVAVVPGMLIGGAVGALWH